MRDLEVIQAERDKLSSIFFFFSKFFMFTINLKSRELRGINHVQLTYILSHIRYNTGLLDNIVFFQAELKRISHIITAWWQLELRLRKFHLQIRKRVHQISDIVAMSHRCRTYVQTTCDNVTSQSSRAGQVLQTEV